MSDVKVCKVMTSYGTTLVVLVPNSSNYNALTSAIEKKHANLYGNLYGEVRVTRMDGFLHENDEVPALAFHIQSTTSLFVRSRSPII